MKTLGVPAPTVKEGRTSTSARRNAAG